MNEKETHEMLSQKLEDVIDEIALNEALGPPVAVTLLLNSAIDLIFFYIPTPMTVTLMSRWLGQSFRK